MKRLLPAFVLLFLSVQDVAAQNSSDDTIRLRQLCTSVATHVPDSDVAYKPGVDADGRAVVPADLNAPPVPMFDPVVIPVEIDLSQYFGAPLPAAGAELKPLVALMKIWQDGRIEYNGAEISAPMKALCEKVRSSQ